MLQIIGWLGCLFLVVKALEIGAGNNFRDERGRLRRNAAVACAVALAGALIFAVWIFVTDTDQGPVVASYDPPVPSSDDNLKDCIINARTPEDVQAC